MVKMVSLGVIQAVMSVMVAHHDERVHLWMACSFLKSLAVNKGMVHHFSCSSVWAYSSLIDPSPLFPFFFSLSCVVINLHCLAWIVMFLSWALKRLHKKWDVWKVSCHLSRAFLSDFLRILCSWVAAWPSFGVLSVRFHLDALHPCINLPVNFFFCFLHRIEYIASSCCAGTISGGSSPRTLMCQ